MNKREAAEVLLSQEAGLRDRMRADLGHLLNELATSCIQEGMPSRLMELLIRRVSLEAECAQEATLAVFSFQSLGQEVPSWVELLAPKDFEKRVKRMIRDGASRSDFGWLTRKR